MAEQNWRNLNNIQRCRACLVTGNNMYHLHERYEINNRNMTNMELLQEIIPVEVLGTEESWPQYICQVCAKRANELYLFKMQCENSLQILKEEFKKFEEKIVVEEKISCNQNNEEFSSHTSPTKYKREHTVTSHSCTYCQASLVSAKLLARHMDDEHSDMKSIKCLHCEKTFFKQANLRLHLHVHADIKKHMCEMCGVSFRLAGNLTAHRRLHTGLKPYVCKQCNRGFTQQAALRSHEAGHSNVKNHVCSECGAAFSRAGALRNHKKRHLSVKPFVCNVCGKAFTFSSELKRHLTIHTGEKKHECDICKSRFSRSTNLAVHRRIHTGEMPHICSVCGKRFNQAHCLRTHMISHAVD